MNISEFDFILPEDLIAQCPVAERGASRLLVMPRKGGALEDSTVADLPRWLKPGDVLVLNNTRVFPARLLGRRDPSGGAVECLLVRRLDRDRWDALVHPGQKLKPGARMRFGDGEHALTGEILERHFYGRRVVRLSSESGRPVDEAIDAIGHVPLPPYVKRPDDTMDRERYQTVYAKTRGSVAAPTAGLHLTTATLDTLRSRDVEIVEITLHVGYGTFKPVRVSRVEDHVVDPETYEVSEPAAAALNSALADRRRIVAVGTTTARALETAVKVGEGRIHEGVAETALVIYPGFTFQLVSGLLTNFHLPKSSLLLLVAAFAGRERLLDAYHHAIAQQYRFYSYGDAMLIV